MPTMQQNTFAGRALPGPAGELKHTPRSPGRKEGPNSKGREGRKGEGTEGEGRGLLLRGGAGGKGRGEEGGREGRILPYQSTFASGAHDCKYSSIL